MLECFRMIVREVMLLLWMCGLVSCVIEWWWGRSRFERCCGRLWSILWF